MSAVPTMPPVSQQLPPEARDLLVAASQVPGEQDRRVAIDAAIDYLRLRFPNHFHHPKE